DMVSSLSSDPWAIHLNTRGDFKITQNLEECDQDPAPHKFNDRNLIRSPDDYRVLTIRECITLHDVIFYRDETARLIHNKERPVDVSSLTMGLEGLSLNKKNFRVIYRYTDIIKKNTLAILEAIHFEIFMPDRPDLRFIAIPLTLLPRDSCEGDYFEIYEVKHSPKLCMMHAGFDYWLSWTVTQFCRVESQGTPALDYIYVAEKEKDSEDRKAVCNWTTTFISARQRRFYQNPNEKNMEVNRIYDANLVDTSSACIYPVEPVKNREEYSKLVQNVKSTSHFAGTFAQEIFVLPQPEQDRMDDRLGEFNEFNRNMKMAEQHMIRLFKLGVRFRQLITPPQKESVFIQNFDPPRLQVYTEVFYLDSVTLHFEEHDIKLIVQNIKRESNGSRKNTYIHCVPSSEVVRVMGS
ncbi:hypothetical protein PENTCL1PPCAC_6150, partial [Pristionchus entomophagus]